MNRNRSALVLFALLFFAAAGIAEAAVELAPKPEGPVNDYAGVISPEYRQKLQSLITELESKTSAEIAVVTVESIAPHDEVSYARLIFDNWKIGKKGKDNGVLVLLAVKERRWRIETGYGVEGILPDGRCGEIGRDYMVGLFKDGRYGEGLYRGVAAIASVIAKDANVELDDIIPAPSGLSVSTNTPIAFFYIFVPIFFFVWNLPWPIYIGLPVTVLFALVFSNISPYLGILAIGSYIASMIFRFTYWRKLPRPKRRNFFGPQTYGGAWTATSGGWGIGGGGFGGGGFGGGGGGGGGAGGGF